MAKYPRGSYKVSPLLFLEVTTPGNRKCSFKLSSDMQQSTRKVRKSASQVVHSGMLLTLHAAHIYLDVGRYTSNTRAPCNPCIVRCRATAGPRRGRVPLVSRFSVGGGLVHQHVEGMGERRDTKYRRALWATALRRSRHCPCPCFWSLPLPFFWLVVGIFLRGCRSLSCWARSIAVRLPFVVGGVCCFCLSPWAQSVFYDLLLAIY